MRTKTLCTSCEQYVYTDADHSCHDAKALRAVRDAEAAVVEAAEAMVKVWDVVDAGGGDGVGYDETLAATKLTATVYTLHAARGQSPQDAEGITRQGDAS
jgi:hypothetical protein